MLVAFQNLEPQYKNYAEEKLKLYHTNKGDECVEYIAIMSHVYDIIYCLSIFSFTDKRQVDQRAICGGTGFDVRTKLSDEIDSIRPKCNYGFTSRGCVRDCPFCVVREKEGYIKAEADIYDIWDGMANKVTLFDNNILAIPEHFQLVFEQIKKENLKVDPNQGLDIRLVDKDIAKILGSVRRDKYHFAFDQSSLDSQIENKVKILQAHGIKDSIFYVLVGYPNYPGETVKDNLKDAMYRLLLLKSLGQNAYVMRYRKIHAKQPDSLINDDTRKLYIALANWGNVRQAFHGMDFFKQYLNHERGKPYKKFYQELGLVG